MILIQHMDEGFKESAREKLYGFILQDRFDDRYVVQDGDYKIIKALVIGVSGLILTAVIVAILALVVHAVPTNI